ncbi:MAG: hypothetical protein A2017_16120 [Lentisphaerae bacterium GWF2_44_16]|nr:MAG: hypothetical protein A2017_16120 [Lentisphaerae bacterium GWF2_44_16]
MTVSKYLKFMPLLVLFMLFSQKAVSQNTGSKIDMSEAGRETVSRQEAELRGDEFVKEGNVAFAKSSYKEAVDKYLKAVESLRKCSPAGEYIQKKIDKCNEAISRSYYYWSEDIAAQAEKLVQAQEYNRAVSLCEEAIKIYPPSKAKMDERIAIYNKMKDVVTYRKEKDPETVDPKEKTRSYSIDVLLKQGEVFYNDGQYDRARDKFEEVLLIDPYQTKAIDFLRKINIKTLAEGNKRTTTTRDERLAEVEWKMVTPVVPRTLSGDTSALNNVSVQKIETEDKIHQKLNNIVIDSIEFVETTIPTVVKYLKKRSKDIDPEKVGVNIFLRLSGTPSAGGGEGGETTEKTETPAADGAEKTEKKAEDGGAAAETTTVTEGTASSSVPTATMVVNDIPLGKAIEYICRGSNLKFRVEKYAVVIASKDVPLDEVETKIYPLDQEALDQIGGSDAETVKRHFENRGIDFPAGSKIVYDNRISRLIATNTPDNLKKIEEIIHNEFDSVDPQVLIQTKFVEVRQNDLEELGFQYTISRTQAVDNTHFWPIDPNEHYGAHLYDANDNVVRNVGTNGVGNIASGTRPDQAFNWGTFYHDGTTVNAVIHALDQTDTSDVLSTPRVTTLNGQEATIRMVTEYYYPEEWGEATIANQSSSTTGGTSATTSIFVGSTPTFGDATQEGIILKVRPNVDADRYTITLEMNPVVQERVGWTDYSYSVTVTNTPYDNIIRMPIIEARTVETTVSIYDGETIILGGIIKDETATINDQYPILGDIPLIGRAFQSKAKSSSKTNLLIFLTCRLVNPDGSPIRARELRGLPTFRQ